MRLSTAVLAAGLVLAGAASPSAASGAPAPTAGGTAWLLQSPLRRYLSGPGELELLWQNRLPPAPGAASWAGSAEPDGSSGKGVQTSSSPTGPFGGRDIKVNAPPFPSQESGELLPPCNTQNEVSIARSGNDVVAGWVDGGQCHYPVTRSGFSLSGYAYSSDDGNTWTDGGVVEPEKGGTLFGDPVLGADADGNFYYATLATNGLSRSIIGVAKSTDGGKTWSKPVDASPGRSNEAFQDKPWLTVDATGSGYDGHVYVAWTEFDRTVGDPRSVLSAKMRMLFSRSIDGGRTFSDPIDLAEDKKIDPGIGAQVAVGPDGEVYVLWLSRFNWVWFTRSLDGGASFSTPEEIAHAHPLGRIQSCGTGLFRLVLDGDIRVEPWPSLAVDTSGSLDRGSPNFNPYRGRIYVALANDTVPECDNPVLCRPPDDSDVALVYSADRGDTWKRVITHCRASQSPLGVCAPQQLNDDGTATDQFHAQVAVDSAGTVMVSWYDRRNSVKDESPLNDNLDLDLYAMASTDGGGSFAPSFRVSDQTFPPSQTNPNSNPGLGWCYMGEYNGMAAGGPEFLLAWGDNRDNMLDLPVGFPDPNVYFDALTVVRTDVRPGDGGDPIRLDNTRLIPVAILTAGEFDATTVLPESVCFGPADDPARGDCTESHGKGHAEDVDGDGDRDLILHYETAQMGLRPGDQWGCLTGETRARRSIRGCDTLKAV